MFLKCVFLTVLAAAVALRGWCALRVHSLFSMDYILTFEFRHMLCSLPTMKQVVDDQALFADGGVVVFTDPKCRHPRSGLLFLFAAQGAAPFALLFPLSWLLLLLLAIAIVGACHCHH